MRGVLNAQARVGDKEAGAEGDVRTKMKIPKAFRAGIAAVAGSTKREHIWWVEGRGMAVAEENRTYRDWPKSRAAPT